MGRGPVFVKHPFSGIPKDELQPALVAYAKKCASDFEHLLDGLLATLRASNPLEVLAILAAHGGRVINEHGASRTVIKDSQFNQSHLELAQAFSLTIPQGDIVAEPPHPAAIQRLFDDLPRLAEAFTLKRMVVMEQERSSQEAAVQAVQELLRMHTQSVRHSAYFNRAVNLIHEVYGPVDEFVATYTGLSVTQTTAIFERRVRSVAQSIENHLHQISAIARQGSVRTMVQKYYELNPQFDDGPDGMIEVMEKHKFEREQALSLIISHCNYRLPDQFVFTAATYAAEIGESEANVKSLLDRLSLSLGDLRDEDKQRLPLDNPVWRKPLIQLGSGTYYCVSPETYFAFQRQILDELIGDNDGVRHKCKARRAEFLETKVAEVFARAFPSAEIVTDFEWKDDDTVFQNDVVVRIDSHLVIVEAKSGVVSWPALRGAPDRARKHINELLVQPSIQSARLAARLRAAIQADHEGFAGTSSNILNLRGVHTVFRVSVTLEDFAMAQSNAHVLKDTGWLPSDHKLAVCVLLTDLEAVFDVLEPVGQKLNYLLRRTELAEQCETVGDELDHLGLYLMTGLNLGKPDCPIGPLVLTGMSEPIDAYFVARAEGFDVKKPRRRMSRWWVTLCEAIERRAFPRWTDATNVILRLAPEEQERMERWFKKVKVRVRAGRADAMKSNAVVSLPGPMWSSALVLLAVRDVEMSRRQQYVNSLASQAFEEPKVASCMVIVVNIDHEEMPYASLAMSVRDRASGTVETNELVVY